MVFFKIFFFIFFLVSTFLKLIISKSASIFPSPLSFHREVENGEGKTALELAFLNKEMGEEMGDFLLQNSNDEFLKRISQKLLKQSKLLILLFFYYFIYLITVVDSYYTTFLSRFKALREVKREFIFNVCFLSIFSFSLPSTSICP